MSGRRSRDKGARYERAVVAWLRAQGRVSVEKRQSGSPDGWGDITGWPLVVVECKDHQKIALAEWVDQLGGEMAEAGVDTGAVIVKRRGVSDVGRHYAVLTVEMWERLMREAGR